MILANVRQKNRVAADFARTSTKELLHAATILDPPPNRLTIHGGSSKSKQAYAHIRHWVYACINAISTRAAAQRACAGELVGGRDNEERWYEALQRKDLPKKYRREIKRRLDRSMKAKNTMPDGFKEAVGNAEIEPIIEHEVLDTLSRPNPVQKKAEFLWSSCANLLATGECYWVGSINEKGRVESWAVPTHWIIPQHDGEMFSGYLLRTHPQADPIPLDKDSVARIYFPDPSDPKGCLSPLLMLMMEGHIDNAILTSQKDMFDRGIFPNVAITVGQYVDENGKSTGRRPSLSGAKRRQLQRVVKQMWLQSGGIGEPAILDGMIESIEKLTNSPREMDWMESGESIKKRILQMLRVNPYILGEVTGVNRAQASVAQSAFADQAVNPLLGKLSEAATDFYGPIWDSPANLQVWFSAWEPQDPQLKAQTWGSARDRGDVNRNEYRAEVLGLPPMEVQVQKSALLETVGGINGAMDLMTAYGDGKLTRESTVALLVLFFEIDKKTAEDVVGEEKKEPPPPALPAPPGALPAPDDPQAGDGQADGEDDSEESTNADVASHHDAIVKALLGIHRKQFDSESRRVADQLARFFRVDRKCNREARRKVGQARSD